MLTNYTMAPKECWLDIPVRRAANAKNQLYEYIRYREPISPRLQRQTSVTKTSTHAENDGCVIRT